MYRATLVHVKKKNKNKTGNQKLINAAMPSREIQCVILLFPIDSSIGMRCGLPMKTASRDYQAETKTTAQNAAQLVYPLHRADRHRSGDTSVRHRFLNITLKSSMNTSDICWNAMLSNYEEGDGWKRALRHSSVLEGKKERHFWRSICLVFNSVLTRNIYLKYARILLSLTTQPQSIISHYHSKSFL